MTDNEKEPNFDFKTIRYILGGISIVSLISWVIDPNRVLLNAIHAILGIWGKLLSYIFYPIKWVFELINWPFEFDSNDKNFVVILLLLVLPPAIKLQKGYKENHQKTRRVLCLIVIFVLGITIFNAFLTYEASITGRCLTSALMAQI